MRFLPRRHMSMTAGILSRSAMRMYRQSERSRRPAPAGRSVPGSGAASNRGLCEWSTHPTSPGDSTGALPMAAGDVR